MKKYGIYYGSTTGTTAEIAKKIAKILGTDEADIHNVASTAPSSVGDYETLILGTSTWGNGELQDNWEDFVNGLEVLDLKGKKIALFGCGDETMDETFCDGVAQLRDRLDKTEAEFIGNYDVIGYTFSHSKAVAEDGVAVGLLLDEVNHPELTATRLRGWCDKISNA